MHRTLPAALARPLSAVLVALAAGCSASHSATGDAGPPDDAALRADAAGEDAAVRCGEDVCSGADACCPGCPGDPPLGCFAGGCPPIACPFEWTRCEDALAGGRAGDPCDFAGDCGEGATCCTTTARCEAGSLAFERDCAPGCLACASSTDCADTEYCDFTTLGCSGPGACMPRPDGCPEDCSGVCGCDGTTYCNACTANAAGASVARPGACDLADCEPQDARGEGGCALFLGYRWNGVVCEGIGGCSCVGTDCAELFDSPEACAAAHAECAADT